jgi:enterobactin synthetase component D
MKGFAKTFLESGTAHCLYGSPEPAGRGTLYPDELGAISGVAANRAADFCAGRRCAREAMRMLGRGLCAVPVGEDRAPIWPAGLRGSISHTDGFACAYLTTGPEPVGVDVERTDRALDPDVWRLILSERERELLEGVEARFLAFSAKEAFFKAAFPVVGRYFGFDAVELEAPATAGRFALRVAKSPGLGVPDGCRYGGSYLSSGPFVLTWIRLGPEAGAV